MKNNEKYFKKFILISFLFLLLAGNSQAKTKWGKGDLQLSEFVLNKFIEYVKGNSMNSPYLFAVSADGYSYNYYYCAQGPNNCRGGDEQIIEECERSSGGVDCSLFARTRTIKWNNGINPGKGKASKINSKWTEEEIIAKLTDLGFVGGIKKKETNSNENIAENLKTLKELLDSGTINKKEFEKAKKKLLN